MWNKFKQELLEGFVALAIACVVLYFFAWILNEPADDLVGWMALGMAASAGSRR
jgi:hypothetical protein